MDNHKGLPFAGLFMLQYLTTAETVDVLPENLEVQIFNGDLSAMPGIFTVYVGIQLNDGTIHYNSGELVQFEVE